MKKCIVQYKNVNENYNCWCNSSWCDNCSTKDLRNENTCEIAPGGYCCCRLCGERKREQYEEAKKEYKLFKIAQKSHT